MAVLKAITPVFPLCGQSGDYLVALRKAMHADNAPSIACVNLKKKIKKKKKKKSSHIYFLQN